MDAREQATMIECLSHGMAAGAEILRRLESGEHKTRRELAHTYSFALPGRHSRMHEDARDIFMKGVKAAIWSGEFWPGSDITKITPTTVELRWYGNRGQ